MKIIRNIIESQTEPDTNSLWVKDGALLMNVNGKWLPANQGLQIRKSTSNVPQRSFPLNEPVKVGSIMLQGGSTYIEGMLNLRASIATTIPDSSANFARVLLTFQTSSGQVLSSELVHIPRLGLENSCKCSFGFQNPLAGEVLLFVKALSEGVTCNRTICQITTIS